MKKNFHWNTKPKEFPNWAYENAATRFFYRQYLYKQRQAEVGKKWNKS